MKQVLVVSGLLLLLLGGAGMTRAAEKYDVDAAHSFLGFTVRHMGISSVRGEFRDYTAEVLVDEEDVANSSLVLKIDVASIDTDNERRDEHLRSADFFEVETYPEIVFKSRQISRQGDGYRATGDLTIKDVTREVSFDLDIHGPIQDPWGNLRAGAEGGLTIDRQDYNVKFNNILDNGGLVVANDVKIDFALEVSRKVE